MSLNHVGGVSLISEEEPGGHLVSPPPVQGPGPVPQLVEVFLAWPGDEEVQVSEEQGVTQQQTHGGGVVAPRRKQLIIPGHSLHTCNPVPIAKLKMGAFTMVNGV